jgi:hypothetical protein
MLTRSSGAVLGWKFNVIPCEREKDDDHHACHQECIYQRSLAPVERAVDDERSVTTAINARLLG